MRTSSVLALRVLHALLIVSGVASCAAPNPDFYYGFDFRNWEDGQTALVLDYKLESHGKILTRATPFYAPFASDGIWINGPRPTSLYVRWKDGDAEFEQTVDLTKILANEEIDSKTLFLTFRRQHLSVFLMSFDPIVAGEHRVGPTGAGYGSRKLIYSN